MIFKLLKKSTFTQIAVVWIVSSFFSTLLILSCSIHGSFQSLYSYQDKTAKVAPYLIQNPTIPVCSLIQPDTPIVYKINGIEVKHCLESLEKSLVYIWRPKCTSTVCISLQNIQIFCQKNGIELFIVAEYYDYETMTLNHPIKRPILGVDCNYYTTNLTKKYMSMFLTDLLGCETTYSENYFFLFNNGCLIDMSGDVQKLKV